MHEYGLLTVYQHRFREWPVLVGLGGQTWVPLLSLHDNTVSPRSLVYRALAGSPSLAHRADYSPLAVCCYVVGVAPCTAFR